MSSLFYGQFRRTRKTLLIGMLVLSGLVAPAHADSDFDEEDLLELYGDDETVSISTGTEQSIRLAPSIASVVTEAEIQNRGATNLQEALEMVPGLHVSLSNNNVLSSVYSIRGIHTAQNPQVLLLIDGVPLRQVFNGGLPVGFTMPVQNIKRIEIIRGPGSAIFGADAFAGVINVISKNAADIDGLKAGVRYGSFDKQDYWLQAGVDLGDSWHYSASLEYAKSNGDDDRITDRDFQTLLDGPFTTNASNAPGPLDTRYDIFNARVALNNERWKTSFLAWLQNDAGTGDGVLHALDPGGELNADYYQFSLSYNNEWTENWRYETDLSLSLLDTEYEYALLPAGALAFIDDRGNLTSLPSRVPPVVSFSDGVLGNPGGQIQNHSFEFVNYYSGWDKHKLRLSVGFQWQDGDSEEARNFGPGDGQDATSLIRPGQTVVDGTLTDTSNFSSVFVEDSDRDIWFASVQDEWALSNDWRLTAGVRFDDYSDSGSTINPRLALVWATSYNLSSKLLYGRAFRAPSFLELSKTNPVLRGNKDIKPEMIDTIEVAFDYLPTPTSSLKLNVFAYQIQDLIAFVPSDLSPTLQLAKNAIDQDGHGFELEYSWKIGDDFSFDGNYAWQHSNSESMITGNTDTVADAPGWQLNLAATWNLLPNWSLSSTLNWVADRGRAPLDPRDEVDDYAIVDLILRRKKLFNNAEIALVARNLFDEEAFEPSAGPSRAGLPISIPGDYPLEGRAIFAEFRYHLGN